MNKKITTSILALMIAGATSFSTYAAMTNGTVVIGSKAFDLGYANNPANVNEISNAIATGGAVYVKDFEGNWIDNLTAKVVQAIAIPAVVYKSADKQLNFDAADRDVEANEALDISSVSAINDKKNIGDAYTLPEKVTVTLANKTTKELAVKWDKVADTKISGEFTFTGTLIMIGGVVNPNNITISAKLIVEDTVNNKKGYVYNTELDNDLKVRSTPNLNGAILGVLYNYEKAEILSNDNGWDKIIYNGSVAYVSSEYIQTYTSPSDNVVNIAKKITKQFEVETLDQIAGNSDGQGLSLGYFQWNIGAKTLQPILNRMDREHNDEMKNIFGTNYNIIHEIILDPENQLTWAKGINDSSNKIIEPWYSQFDSLCNSKDFIDIEADAEVYTIKQAMRICDKYELNSIRGFALAFDIVVQNGSISSNSTIIIDTALDQTPNMTEKDLLRVIANAVADDSGINSEDVRSRKMAIVNGHGTVHNSILNLDTNYGLSDNSWR